jgi:2-(1,2-epoxy-1,2-dihydrophenyl)acetyl-CoA isomerase
MRVLALSSTSSDAQSALEQIAAELYRALAVWDTSSLATLLHPEFTGHATPGLPFDLGGDYVGPEQMMREFWAKIGRNYKASATPERYSQTTDGSLLVEGHYVGRSRRGGALDAEFTHLLTFLDGRIRSLSQLTDSRKWWEALQGGEQEPVSYSFENGVAAITLERPSQRNAIDQATADCLLESAIKLQNEAGLRTVVIRGAGAAFTVGGDLAEIAQSAPKDLPALLRRMITPFHQALNILDSLSVPVISSVRGAVAGGGLGLLHVSDIVIVAEGTRFAAGFAALGLTGDGGGTWFMPRLVGPKRAAQFYLQQRVLNADEALDWGLVTTVCAEAELDRVTEQAVHDLSSGPTVALGGMRLLLRSSLRSSLAEHLAAEIEQIANAAGSADAPAAIASFMAKTTPTFEGR